MEFIRTIWAFILRITAPIRNFLVSLVEPWEGIEVLSIRRKARLSAAMALIMLLFNLIGMSSSINVTELTTTYSLAGLCILLLTAYLLSRTHRYRIGALLLVISLSLLAYLPLFIRKDIAPIEISNSIYSFLPISLVIASALLGLWEMFFGAIINMVAISAIPAFFPEYSFAQSGTDAGNIVTIGFLLLIVVGYRDATERERLSEIEKVNLELKEANKEIIEARDTLETRVEERTTEVQQRSEELAHRSQELEQRSQELEQANNTNQRRATQFEAIAQVSRSIASVRNINELLPQITQLISKYFGFYHVGIFLADEAKAYAVLSASNSEGGQHMLQRGHRLEIGQVGIVGYVVGTGLPRVALDTGTDAIHFKNPDLPDTHSEMALPLRAENEVIGALDVQSLETNAFSQEDVAVLSTLADQVTIAIQNARLFESTQKSLVEAEAMYRQYLRKEWSQVSERQKIGGYRYNILGTASVDYADAKKIEQVTSSGKAFVEKNENGSMLALPITLRGEVIGILDVQASGDRDWQPDEIEIAQAVADRVAISAENARLFEETTNRAEREKMVSEITSKIRSTNDPNQMLQVALSEIRRTLKVKDARIIPYTPPQDTDKG